MTFEVVKTAAHPTESPNSRLTFWPRITIVLALGTLAYIPLFINVVRDTLGGSRAAYLVVVPVLAAMIANRYRTTPRGVGDAESDWIVALLFGAWCFTGLSLVTHRLPSTSNLWHLNLVSVVVWFACSTAVVFGVRYASRMAALWLFTLVCATPLPYLLVTAYLGGSDTAAAMLAAALGSTALFISGRATLMRWRAPAAIACLGTAVAAVLLLRQSSLLVMVVVAAGVIPAAYAVGIHRFSVATDRNVTVRSTQRSWVSFAVLAAFAVVLLATNLPLFHMSEPPVARDDWALRSELSTPVDYPFIARFMGPGASFTRYAVAPSAGLPNAAVDVIATPIIGALRDFSDAVWYPTDVPVNFRPINVNGPVPVAARAVHNNADSITGSDGTDWYALTWLWRSAALIQQVTVIVNQASDQRLPPNPQSLSLQNTLIQPLLWIGRQQPDSLGTVNSNAVERAADIASMVLLAGDPTDG